MNVVLALSLLAVLFVVVGVFVWLSGRASERRREDASDDGGYFDGGMVGGGSHGHGSSGDGGGDGGGGGGDGGN